MFSIPTVLRGWLAAVILGVVAMSVATVPAQANQDWTVETLMQALSEVEHAELDFKETRKSILLITDLTTRGTMEYRSPDFIEKVTLSPFMETVTIDGDTMTLKKENDSSKQDNVVRSQVVSVQSHPLLKAAVESIRSMLAGDYETLRESYDVSMTGSREAWELSLVPRIDEMLSHVAEIQLSGDDIRIAKVVTIQPDGDETLLALTYRNLN